MRPVLILGAPRSGTSALSWAIGQHPNIAVLPETGWFPALGMGAYAAYKIGTARGEHSQLSNARIQYDPFMAEFGATADRIVREGFERQLEESMPGFRALSTPPWKQEASQSRLIHHPLDPKQRWVDGTPYNSFYAYILSVLFPDAQFIHIIRHPSLVVNSLMYFDRAGGDGKPAAPAKALQVWRQHVNAAVEAESMLGDRIIRIRNDELRERPGDVMREVFGFLGEEFDERTLLPLSGNINSSRAASELEATLKTLAGVPEYAEAVDYYNRILASRVIAEPSGEARARHRQDFEKRLEKMLPLSMRGAA